MALALLLLTAVPCSIVATRGAPPQHNHRWSLPTGLTSSGNATSNFGDDNETCGYNDCTNFCAGRCPFRANMSTAGAVNLTVYRLTPWNITDLVNHNTGTAAGDVGFMLNMYMAGASHCRPPYNTHSCFLADHPLVGRFHVEFDAEYGPYTKCNPTYLDHSSEWLNMTRWLCAYGYPGHDPWKPTHPDCADCDRVNVSVGADPAQHTWNRNFDIDTRFGGLWFSTPERGQCRDGHVPRDGSGCTWRERGQADFVNASCVADRLFAVVRAANPSCFAACGPDDDHPGTGCFTECVTHTVMGYNATAAVDPDSVVAAYVRAFNDTTGCPRVDVEAMRRERRLPKRGLPRRPPRSVMPQP